MVERTLNMINMSELRLRRKSEDAKDIHTRPIATKYIPSKDKTKWTCRSVIHVVLVIVCLIESLCLYHLYPRSDDTTQGKAIPPNHGILREVSEESYGMTEEDLVNKFPGFFHEAYDHLDGRKEDDQESTGTDEKMGNVHQHGCCLTSGAFRTPAVGFNVMGQERKLVQLKRYKQHFYYETSQKVEKCHRCLCTCRRLTVWVPAVYVSDSGVLGTEQFNVSYVFKCFT